MNVVGLYEKNLSPLEIVFNLKFGVEVTGEGLKLSEDDFYIHLRSKLGLFAVERSLSHTVWPPGWKFSPCNTRYTYEHSWQAVRQRLKPSYLGMDIALGAPEELREDEKVLKEKFIMVSNQISDIECFKPSDFIRLIK